MSAITLEQPVFPQADFAQSGFTQAAFTKSFFAKSVVAQNILVSAVTSLVLVVAGLMLAYWTWVWFAPQTAPRALAAIQAGEQLTAAYDLFGNTQQRHASAAPTGMAIKLLGIVAATPGHSGYAVVQLNAKETRAVRVGENIAPGIRLAAAGTDHLILERGGVRETLAWPVKNVTKP